MSWVLVHALGTRAGPGSVRPRLPTLFEPGLDIASGPMDGAAGAGGVMSEPVLAAGPLAAGMNVPPIPADPSRELPSDALTVPGLRQPAAEPRQPAWPPPFPLTEPAGRPVASGPRRTEDASPMHAVRPQRAHPVGPVPALPVPALPVPALPVPALPVPPSPAGSAASAPRPPGGAATAITPMTPVDQRPPPARREPVRPRYQLDAGPESAQRRSVARQARGTADAEPTVHITIGRVDIRAGRATAQPGRPAARRRPAAPDLSEYLQRRGNSR